MAAIEEIGLVAAQVLSALLVLLVVRRLCTAAEIAAGALHAAGSRAPVRHGMRSANPRN